MSYSIYAAVLEKFFFKEGYLFVSILSHPGSTPGLIQLLTKNLVKDLENLLQVKFYKAPNDSSGNKKSICITSKPYTSWFKSYSQG